MRRLRSLDLIRGVGILVVVFLHAALYQFDGLFALDLDHPPFVITVIGLLLMLAGVFAFVSGASHLVVWTDRISDGSADPRLMRRSLAITGGLLLILNVVYFMALGPTLLDFQSGRHQYSLLNGLIETGRVPDISWKRFFYNTALSMLGWNCLIVALLAPVVFPLGSPGTGLRTTILLAVAGGAVVIASYIRIPLYPVVERAIEDADLATAFAGAVFFNKNDPLLPYLGFALIGAALGHAFAAPPDPRSRVTLAALVFGLVWLAAGVAGYAMLPDTMLERSVDEMWYTIVIAQVGLFVLLLALSWRALDGSVQKSAAAGRPGVFRLCGAASLTIFVWETPVRSLYALLWDWLVPGWGASIPVVLLFALSMALLWAGVVRLWGRARFVGSMEWLMGRAYALAGRPSSKEAALGGAGRSSSGTA